MIDKTLDNAIENALRMWFADYEVKPKEMAKKSVSPIATISSQIAEAEKQEEKICEMLERGVYSIEQFEKRNAVIAERLAKLRQAKKDAEQNARRDQAKDSIIPTARHLLDNYNDLSVAEKNQLLRLIVKRIEAYRKDKFSDIEITLYPNL